MEPRADELERRLEELAAFVEFPEPDDVAARVAERLSGLAPPRRVGILLRPALAASILLVVSMIGLLVGFPAARRAVAGWLRIPGVNITLKTPSPASPTAEIRGGLGKRVAFTEAKSLSRFSIEVSAILGDPDEVWVASSPKGGRVSLIWYPRSGLPATSDPTVGLFVTQFIGHIEREIISKAAGTRTRIEAVTIRGNPGFWLEGEPHFFLYRDDLGEIKQETVRLAGNTLLWTHAKLTLRLESALTKGEAIRLAESFD